MVRNTHASCSASLHFRIAGKHPLIRFDVAVNTALVPQKSAFEERMDKASLRLIEKYVL